MNKKEIKLAKEYIDRDLEEYFIYEIDKPYQIALTKLSKELKIKMNKQKLINQYKKRIRLLYKDMEFIYDEYMENIPLAVKDYNECKLEITILKQVIKELNKLWMIT